SGQHSFLHLSPEGNRLGRLVVNITGGGVLNIASPMDVMMGVKIAAGTLAANGNVRLVSTVDRTAFIASIEGQGRITGGVTVEQYWHARGSIIRYISATVENVAVADWQASFPITGSFTGASGGVTTPSLHYFDRNQWLAYPPAGGSNSAPIERARGYAARMPADDGVRTLIVRGTPYQGEIAFELSPGDASAAWGGWSFVANPYASPVRWTADNAAWLASGVSNVVAVRRDTLIDGQLRSKVLYHDATLGGGVIRA